MVKFNVLAVVSVTLIMLTSTQPVFSSDKLKDDRLVDSRDYELAIGLYERGMYERAKTIFDGILKTEDDMEIEAYSLLCSVFMKSEGYERTMDNYIKTYPYSGFIPQIRYNHALNLFDTGEYAMASSYFEVISKRQLHREQVDEFLFKKAYCDFQSGNLQRALIRFDEIEKRAYTDFTSPSRYASGYISYGLKNFEKAVYWFKKSAKDSRFADISKYYILESKFMLKDYEYVVKVGDEIMEASPEDRARKIKRMISESYLVLGDSQKAKQYYEEEIDVPKTRNDYFYSASVLYAVEDYKGAIDKFLMMKDRTDSIGQVANYHLAYSYIKTKNKVAAMTAFEAASDVNFDEDITKDAFFNLAKLKFDLNQDATGFKEYLAKYSNPEKRDIIYSYIAVAALFQRDYAGAIVAYDEVEELDDDMKSNYIKANYLRASELVGTGSYRTAIPYLKSVVYYTEKTSMFNQLSRFWLAESNYRNYDFDTALGLYKELYNNAALYRMSESYLIPYNIAYIYYKKNDYPSAVKWFRTYLEQDNIVYRKEANLRLADCYFTQADYSSAVIYYNSVVEDYYDVNDIYPYYQAAIAYGLNNNVARKIELLTWAEGAKPSSPFYTEALYELGRTYARQKSNNKAISTLNNLISKTSDSVYIAKSYIVLGTIARDMSDENKAISYYKKVVEDMPNTQQAEDALLAMESVYQSISEPEKYLAYLDEIGKSGLKTEEEKERMIFNAAEQTFLSDNYDKALIMLRGYLSKYPSGLMISQANFYIADSYKNLGKKDQACDYYKKVIDAGENSYVEIATINFANITFELERFDEANQAYKYLAEVAVLPNSNFISVLGIMRTAYKLKSYAEAQKYSNIVIDNVNADEKIKRESKYILAKSYMATSKRTEAFAVLAELAKDPNTAEGAEATYMMIQDMYDRGEFESVEAEVYNFADKNQEQQYWLARTFVVLADSFVERDNLPQARATFESILDGYTPKNGEDDVIALVKDRIALLGELEEAEAKAQAAELNTL